MQAVILAAGESSRFWPLNYQHKSLLKIMGQSLIRWTVKSLVESGFEEIIIVHGTDSSLKTELGEGLNCKISYVLQEKPLGTGDAVFKTRDLIKGPFFVLHPYKFYLQDIVGKILEKGVAKAKIAIFAAPTDHPQDYGVLKMTGNRVTEICENPLPGKEPSKLRTLGLYLLNPDFFNYYEKIKKHHPEDLIDALNLLVKEELVEPIVLEKEPPTLKYPWDLFGLSKLMFDSEAFQSYIFPSADVRKNVVINGKVYIGDKAVIKENTVINGPCYIGDGCEIGASNVLRGPIDLEKEVKTGAFCEIKNSIVQEGTHFHSGYIGDSLIGQNCRFGAGFISANKRLDRNTVKPLVKGTKIDTGMTHFGVVVGHDTKFGIHCGTMPGVLIGSNCGIWPGSIVFNNLEDNSTFRKD